MSYKISKQDSCTMPLIQLFGSFPSSSVGMQLWPLRRPIFHNAGAWKPGDIALTTESRESTRMFRGYKIRFAQICVIRSFSFVGVRPLPQPTRSELS